MCPIPVLGSGVDAVITRGQRLSFGAKNIAHFPNVRRAKPSRFPPGMLTAFAGRRMGQEMRKKTKKVFVMKAKNRTYIYASRPFLLEAL